MLVSIFDRRANPIEKHLVSEEMSHVELLEAKQVIVDFSIMVNMLI